MIIQKIISALGTVNTVFAKFDEKDREKVNNALTLAEQYIRELDDRLSVFKPDSEISRLNKSAGKAVTVSADTMEIIKLSVIYNDLTDGTFNIGTKPLTDLYRREKPDKSALAKAVNAANSRIIINGNNNTVKLKNKNAALDFGGIAKGYAMDKLLALFKEHGVENAMINLGGTVCSIGEARKIGIQNPFTPVNSGGKQEIIAYAESSDEIFVTSGTYESGNHIINPKTGEPAEAEILAVTVIGKNGALLDAVATACVVKGLNGAVKLLEKNNLGGIFVLTDGKIYITNNVKDRIIIKE